MIKKIYSIMMLFAVLFVIMPYFLVKGYSDSEPQWQSFKESISAIAQNTNYDMPVKMKMPDGSVDEIPLKDYLYGSVAAEISPDSPPEALKAQAVASYTYMLYRKQILEENPDALPTHGGAYVCCDSSHCKAYISKDEAYEKWGREYFNSYWKRLTDCVDSVVGKAITYDGNPIDAVFFAISSGKTEDCVDVWGSDIPYLKSVDSPYDGEANGYLTTVTLSYDETTAKLKTLNEGVDLSSPPEELFSDIVKSETGNVLSVNFGEVTLSGKELRKALGLRSSIFDTTYENGNYVFTVKGYGHGVGLSQAGAIAMAEKGSSYEEILKHYYTDVEITDFSSVV